MTATPGHTAPLPGLVVLASGEGTNLQAIMDAINAGRVHARIAAVISDRRQAHALERAREAGIRAEYVGRPAFADRTAHEAAIAHIITEENPRGVVLAGFMRILGPAFVRSLEGRIINLHPSLLPKYRGLDTHARALAAGDVWHGASMHFVTEELDAGPPILQYRLKIQADDTAETLAARVHVGEHLITPQVADWLANGRIRLQRGTVWFDDKPLEEPLVVEADD